MKLPERYALSGGGSSGGMGGIFFCDDLHLQRRVVVKLLKDGEDERRLLDEQRALIQLRSKHVVQLFDVIKIDDRTNKKALVLEYIDGENLQLNGYVPGEEFLNVLWQIACGLKDIHAAHVIHRDIKPQNIRIDASRVVKILDFGLARQAGNDANTRNIIGTIGYMAPELWHGSTISFDSAIDVYAYGVMALTLLGQAPPDEILVRPPRPIPVDALVALRGSLPNAIVDTLERCLSYVPANRPRMEEVEELLRRHLLKDKHRALAVMGGKTHELHAASRKMALSFGNVGTLEIVYDGFQFLAQAQTGLVSINNMPVAIGRPLPDCCVITFGVAGSSRAFVTFDVSNPEVAS